MLTQVAQLGVLEWCLAQQLPSRLRKQDLAAVSRGAHSRCTVDAEADVPLVGGDRLCGVDADPHADVFVRAGALHQSSSGNRVARARKGDEERVALRVHLVPALLLEDHPCELTVVQENARELVAELLQQPSRTLDVREEEGDCATRKLGHRPMMRRCRVAV